MMEQAVHEIKNEQDQLAGVLSIRKLLGRKTLFSIPSYQRGYRWKRENVEALLDDLLEFSASHLPAYCMQPIVMQRCTIEKDGASENGYRIVDGQQRLTTLTIVLKALGISATWDMKYETAEGSPPGDREGGKWLSELMGGRPGDRADTGINGWFRQKAGECVESCLKEDPSRKESLLHAMGLDGQTGKDVVFIGYVLGENDGARAHDMFNLLNDGKVSLTSAELIKAFFELDSNGLEAGDKLEIAKEWELIERALHDEKLWRIFFRGDAEPYTRIEELFATVAGNKKAAERLPQEVFHSVEHRILRKNGGRRPEKKERSDRINAIWREVVELFWWMKSCAADVEIANYLGWVALFRDYQLKTLHEIFKNGKLLLSHDELDSSNVADGPRTSEELKMGRFACFKQNLMAFIARRIRICYPDQDIGKDFSGVCYVHKDWANASRLRALFVLLNVCACNKAREFFRFDLYTREKHWDVDHIYLQSEAQNLADGEADVNGIWNLALVDTRTNESGPFKIKGQGSFAAKRSRIREQMQGCQTESQGHYIVPLSQRVYMKFYSHNNVADVWKHELDGKPYQKALESYWQDFLRAARVPSSEGFNP